MCNLAYPQVAAIIYGPRLAIRRHALAANCGHSEIERFQLLGPTQHLNSLPVHLRHMDITPNLFKHNLKAFIFASSIDSVNPLKFDSTVIDKWRPEHDPRMNTIVQFGANAK